MQEFLWSKEIELLHYRLCASSASLCVAELLSSMIIPLNIPTSSLWRFLFSVVGNTYMNQTYFLSVCLYEIVNFYFLTSDSEFLFMFLLTSWFFSFENHLFASLAYISIGSFVFLICNDLLDLEGDPQFIPVCAVFPFYFLTRRSLEC